MGQSENLTILLTDIAGFSERTVSTRRDDMKRLLDNHDRMLKATVRFYEGRYIKSTGDGMLAVFRACTNAVHCGMAIQDTLAEFNYAHGVDEQLHVRVAINLGEVQWVGRQDIVGEAVNITSRLEEITPPGGVYLTGSVYLAMNKAEVPAEHVGVESFKGFVDSFQIFRVPPKQTDPHASRAAEEKPPLVLPYGGMPRPSAQSFKERYLSPREHPLVFAGLGAAGAMLLLVLLAYFGGWLAPEKQESLRELVTFWNLGGPAQTARAPAKPSPDLPAPESPTSTAAPPPAARSIAPPVKTHALLTAGEQKLLLGDIAGVRALIAGIPAQDDRYPQALMLRGHLAFRDRGLDAALAAYEEALAADPDLKSDEQLARNLVGSLGFRSARAAALIRAHATRYLLQELERRTGEAGEIGRRWAISLMEELGAADQVRRHAHALLELSEQTDCDLRRAAVIQLGKDGLPDALPVLRAMQEPSLAGWWQNRCLRQDLARAIGRIEARR